MSDKQSDRAAEKRNRFEQWMKGDYVLVHLDARKEDVEVPASHQGNPSLTLKLSYYFQGETSYDDRAVVSYLKFGGHYVRCVLPWSSVWGMTDCAGETQVWAEDVPREVYLQMARSKLAEVGKRLLGKSAGKDAGGKDAGAAKDASPKKTGDTGADKAASEKKAGDAGKAKTAFDKKDDEAAAPPDPSVEPKKPERGKLSHLKRIK